MFRYLKNNFIAIDNDFKCTVAEFLQLEPNANFDGIDEIYYSNDRKYQIVNGNQTGYYNTDIDTYIANKQDYIDTLAEWNAPTPPTLEEVKQSKLAELELYYASDECWLFQIQDGDASLTKTIEWFGRMIPAIAGFNIILLDDNGQPQSYLLTEKKAKTLNYKIQVKASFTVAQARLSIIQQINSATTPEEIELIDIKQELSNIPRVIVLADI